MAFFYFFISNFWLVAISYIDWPSLNISVNALLNFNSKQVFLNIYFMEKYFKGKF